LELRDQIEGVVFCDYEEKSEEFICKPEPAFYHKVRFFVLCASCIRLMASTDQAMDQAGVRDPTKCLFVDDSLSNVEGAKHVGWIRSVHFRECDPEAVDAQCVNHTARDQDQSPNDGIPIISDLQQLREVWSDVFVEAKQ
jgi:pyrimidine and pyridine-specific 5'-nucleotidase